MLSPADRPGNSSANSPKSRSVPAVPIWQIHHRITNGRGARTSPDARCDAISKHWSGAACCGVLSGTALCACRRRAEGACCAGAGRLRDVLKSHRLGRHAPYQARRWSAVPTHVRPHAPWGPRPAPHLVRRLTPHATRFPTTDGARLAVGFLLASRFARAGVAPRARAVGGWQTPDGLAVLWSAAGATRWGESWSVTSSQTKRGDTRVFPTLG